MTIFFIKTLYTIKHIYTEYMNENIHIWITEKLITNAKNIDVIFKLK